MPSKDIEAESTRKWNAVAKPLNGLGELEHLITRIAMIRGTTDFQLSKRARGIMISDNGIVEEGVSQSKSDVTLAVANLMADDLSSVGKMIKDVDTFPIDIGIKDGTPGGKVIHEKIREGSRNFMKEPAQTQEETLRAIEVGINLVKRLSEEGYDIVATGEMGIGNTTTSSTILAEMLRLPVPELTGKGAGLSDEGYAYKCNVIERALSKYDMNGMILSLYSDLAKEMPDTFTGSVPDIGLMKRLHAFLALSTFGGYDISGLAGVFIGGAMYHMPIVIDGVISATAAYIAEQILPGTKEYMLPSHLGSEPAMQHIYDEMNLTQRPVICAGLHLGEGTGAVMLFPLLDMAKSLYDGTKFLDTDIEPYKEL